MSDNKKQAEESSAMESMGLKNRKRLLKRQDAIDCEESGDNNPLVKLVVAHFKESGSDFDQSILNFIKDFCLEKMMREELTVEKLVPPVLDEAVAAAVAELTKILNSDSDIYKKIEKLKAGYAKEAEDDSKKKVE